MAKPRVFISSTYYDLRYIREDIARFIREQGYDPVLFERGQIAYGREQAPADYCLKEIELCDILVSVVGGRFGSEFGDNYSITQKEFKQAFELGKQVYIFMEKNVKSEYETYKINKDVDIKYRFVNDKRIYEFIEELELLPRNNPMFDFESSQDIIKILKEQWSGLFQRLLQEEADKPKLDLINTLKQTAATLQQIITVQSERDESSKDAIKDIIIFNHPAFHRLQNQLGLKFRMTFTNLGELNEFLQTFGFERNYDPFLDCIEWNRTNNAKTTKYTLKVDESLFDESKNLKPWDITTWDDSLIMIEREEIPLDINDDDLPF